MKTRLKDLKLESVDLCYKGCNPEAKINLFKSVAGEGSRALGLSDFTPEEIEQLKALLEEAEVDCDDCNTCEDCGSEYTTEPENNPRRSGAGLFERLRMLLGKGRCKTKKSEPEVQKSKEDENLAENDVLKKEDLEKGALETGVLEKVAKEQVDTLLQKMSADFEAKFQELNTKLEEKTSQLEKAQKDSTLAEMMNVAKQFTDDKVEDVAKHLVDLKAVNEDLYKAHLDLLQQNKTLVKANKAFEELGKSGGYSAGSTSKIEAVATELQKQDPSLDYWQARAKAWDLNPDIKKEYEEELI